VSTVRADLNGKSDAELINAVRGGEIAAYGTLFERHSTAAHNLARQLARSGAEADDLVSEAFAKVLDTLRAGKGPDSAFRAYLLTALRHTAYDKTRKDKRIDLTEDMSDAGGAVGEALTVQFSDTAVAGLERTMAAKAFARLPERWQAVLWHTEIEQQTPAEVAPLLGLTSNGVSALAYRAREGLRQAYLQVHLAETSAERCHATAERLGAWVRDGLSKRERAQVETHLDECERCRALAAELADVNSGLRLIIAPMVLGGAVTAYLAAAGAKAGVVTAGMAAAAAAGTAGASSAGAAAGAASGLPRQLAGVGASGAAIAAAVIVGLAVAGGPQQISAAAQQPTPPPPAVSQPHVPPPPVVPKPNNPPPPVVPPVSPPATTPPAAPPPAVPPAAPAPAKVTSAQPANVELEPGAGPVTLPITVKNDGGTVSDPVSATLNLPPGVTAVPAGGGGGTSGGAGFSARSDTPITVNCPGGTGTVTCKTEKGLEPGQSAVLNFRLQADDTAQPGTVTGSVSSGTQTRVSVSVQVKVKQPPDAVTVLADAAWEWALPWNPNPVLHIKVQNTGPTTKPVSITIDHPGYLVIGSRWARCRSTADGTTCLTWGALKPGGHLNLWVLLKQRPPHDEGVTVTATLGVATTAADPVYFDCWGRSCKTPSAKTSTPAAPSPTNTPNSTASTGDTPEPNRTPDPQPPVTQPSQPIGPGRQPDVTTSEPPPPETTKSPTRPGLLQIILPPE
jgi:RNA polymerase sigma factor (sigma-70 family)